MSPKFRNFAPRSPTIPPGGRMIQRPGSNEDEGHSRHGRVSSGGSMRGTWPLWGCQGVRAGADLHAVTAVLQGSGRVSDRSGRAAEADARRPSMLRRRSLTSQTHAHGAGQLCGSGGPDYGTLRASRHPNARRRATALKINAFVRTGSTVCATVNIVTTHHRDQAVNSDGPSRLETTASPGLKMPGFLVVSAGSPAPIRAVRGTAPTATADMPSGSAGPGIARLHFAFRLLQSWRPRRSGICLQRSRRYLVHFTD
jgi:hypothetical protein